MPAGSPPAGQPIVDQMPMNFTAITPSDSTDTTATARFGIWVGTGGNVALKDANGGAAVTFKNVPSGTMLWGQLSRVMSTNTTATDIIGLG